MHQYLRKLAALGFLVFLTLWVIGGIRGITLPYPPPMPVAISGGLEREFFSSSGNYANNLKQIGLTETPLPLVLDNPEAEKIRIVEKRATLTSGTPRFVDDEAALRAAIKAQQATVFNEKSTGMEPGRKLLVEIGVGPEKFEDLIALLQKIGRLSSISVEQKDRTSEFRKLFGQRHSLKKYLEAMTKLRSGKALLFEDSLKLEQKIQDLEKEMQSLTTQFGDLLGKESYYHVQLTLAEYQSGDARDHTYTIPQRIGHAFLWAVAWWVGIALSVGVIAAAGVSVWTLRSAN